MKKPKISPGPWSYIDDPDMAAVKEIVDADGNEIQYNILIAFDLDNEDWTERTSNGEAIVTAVNNTYHKGIDPEAVPDMKEALINARKELITAHHLIGSSCIEDVQFEIEEALEKAGVDLNEKSEA